MCELLGMSANVPTDICFSFSGLRARGGRTGPHKDGWGMAMYRDGDVWAIHDPRPSADSDMAEVMSHTSLKCDIVISHIRQANVGAVCLLNTHPFSRSLWGKTWSMLTMVNWSQLRVWRSKKHIHWAVPILNGLFVGLLNNFNAALIVLSLSSKAYRKPYLNWLCS